MQVKLFELRDSKTFIPIIAVRDDGRGNEGERYLVRRAGLHGSDGYPPVLLTRLTGGGNAESDPYAWGDRTFQTAHIHLEKNFDAMQSGDVIDVEFILGETTEEKVSERKEA